MTAHAFGEWGFSVLIWVFTLLSALWGYELVKHLIRQFYYDKVVQEAVIEDAIKNDALIQIVERVDDWDD